MFYNIFHQSQCDLPPTLYSIMESLVNYPDGEVKIKDLWQSARIKIFDFNYTLNSNVDKVEFEHAILNHFLMRRINYDTVTLFKIYLENKLNEIMPKYNVLFSGLNGWELFNAGTTTREYKEFGNGSSSATTHTTDTGKTDIATNSSDESDQRQSDTPQGQLEEIRNGEYITQYNYNTGKTNNTSNSTSNNTNDSTNVGSTTDNKEINETVKRTAENELDIILKFQQEYNNIMTMIYKDLNVLFYGLY